MKINSDFQSKNFRSRQGSKVEFLVLHYTAVPLGTTLGIFTNNAELAAPDAAYFAGTDTDPAAMCKGEVSAHYVNSEAGEIFQLVSEDVAAFHAGVSYWNGVKNINNQSIGIEQVNIGFDWLKQFPQDRAAKVKGSDNTWCHFTAEQIQATIELCKEIIDRHGIMPHNIVGHSDVACGRKSDPGPLYPWKQLAEAGIGLWYDRDESELNEDNLPLNPVFWMQTKLSEYGYDCPITGEKDERTVSVIKSFQMHFRPENIDGIIDLECMQILDSLCERKLACELSETEDEEQTVSSSAPVAKLQL